MPSSRRISSTTFDALPTSVWMRMYALTAMRPPRSGWAAARFDGMVTVADPIRFDRSRRLGHTLTNPPGPRHGRARKSMRPAPRGARRPVSRRDAGPHALRRAVLDGSAALAYRAHRSRAHRLRVRRREHEDHDAHGHRGARRARYRRRVRAVRALRRRAVGTRRGR